MAKALCALILAVLAAGCGQTRTVVRTVTVSSPELARYYGHIVSLDRRGSGYLLRFDPAWFVTGVTANVAQAEDTKRHCPPLSCPPVANDSYVVDEDNRTLTFIVPANAHGSVLLKRANGGGLPSTRISVAQLAALVHGRTGATLWEPLSTGVWITVRVDRVVSFRQQYRP